MRMPLYFFVIRKKNTRKRRGRKRLSAERATRHPRREVGDPMILEKMSPACLAKDSLAERRRLGVMLERIRFRLLAETAGGREGLGKLSTNNQAAARSCFASRPGAVE